MDQKRRQTLRRRQTAADQRKSSRLNTLVSAKLLIDLVTLFPEAFDGYLSSSLIGKSINHHLLSVHRHNPRDFAQGRHRQVDDRPYGGGPGMILMAEPIYQTLRHIRRHCRPTPSGHPLFIALSPRGQGLNPSLAKHLASKKHLVLLAGHYEGIDERILRHFDMELSIGDYVTMGGEAPAMVVMDAVARYVPGLIGDDQSTQEESFSMTRNNRALLEWPQYTRPSRWRNLTVPKVLLGGDHQKIASWRWQQAIRTTAARRLDLVK